MHRFPVTVPFLTLALATGCPEKVAELEPEPESAKTEAEPEGLGDTALEHKSGAAPDPAETDEDSLDEEATDEDSPGEEATADEEDNDL